jgi:dihydroorotate dehydrogenase electron transfer subunit
MMQQTHITLTHLQTIAPAWWQLTFDAPGPVSRLSPGQFLLARLANPFHAYLRRPLFPNPVDETRLSLLLPPTTDPGQAWLLTRRPGDTVEVLGPLGHGFPLPAPARRLLLVSDARHLSPLLGQMHRAIAAGLAVTLALDGSRAEALYPLKNLPAAVEVRLATRDGSAGLRGSVADLLPDLLAWADLVCAVGSLALYRALKLHAAAARFRLEPGFMFGLMDNGLLPCGVGVCLGCPVETAAGQKLACLHGPVFDLAELEL